MSSCLVALGLLLALPAWAAQTSLRFYGHGVAAPDLDRVKIPLHLDPSVNVGAFDFTIEFWMKAALADNGGSVSTGNDGWITGNILLDRDVYGPGDYGDWGISLGGGRVAFGVNNGAGGNTVVTTNSVADGSWHHVACVRLVNGFLRIYVDGQLQAAGSGPTGLVDYRSTRTTAFTNSDPFLVLGAEKHDAGAEYPSYNGWLDEIRVSGVARYLANFTRPSAPFAPDAQTAALYHLDEGQGDAIGDSATGPGLRSHGVRRFGGGGLAGPVWSSDSPFTTNAPAPGVAGFQFPTGSAGLLVVTGAVGRTLAVAGGGLNSTSDWAVMFTTSPFTGRVVVPVPAASLPRHFYRAEWWP